MSRKYIAFDLETAKVQRPEDPNWKKDRPLGISCAATLRSDSNEPLLWHGTTKTKHPACRMSQEEAGKLVDYLATEVRRGYTILTWNGVGFDFDILAEESGMLEECKRLALGHVDMMFHVLCQLGFGVSLRSAARAAGIVGKDEGIDGANAPRFWAEGKRKEVLQYVAHDAWMTVKVATLCEQQGCLCWIRTGKRRKMPLRRGWLSVRDALRLPKPRNAWMYGRWSRSKWTAWMR